MRYAMLGLILALNLTVMLVTAETAAAASVKLTNEQCEADRSQLIHCGSAPSAFFSENGSLWVTFEYQQHVWMSRSADNGQTYTPATRVTHAAENIEINGENRPKIIVDEAGATIYVSWTQKTAGMHTGDIRFTRSTDAGVSFEPARTINDDGLLTSHRFESMFLSASGLLYLTWLDKRELEYAATRGEPYRGSGVFYTYSEDQGANFANNRKIADHSCECCRIAVAPHGQDGMALLWRHVFDTNTRDHAIATVNRDQVNALTRASNDDWNIDACPHHGPTMVSSPSADDVYHLGWFSAGNINQGIYYGRHDLRERSTSQLMQIDGNPGAGHPSISAHNGQLYIVWKRFNGVGTDLLMIVSADEGESWSDETVVATTDGGADHPLLTAGPDGLFVSWMTQADGYRFVRVSGTNADIRAFTADTFSRIKQDRAGEAFLVSLWSVDCPPCLVELDMLGRLLKEQPSLPLVLISTDDIRQSEDAMDFLLDYGLEGITSWMFADSFAERLRFSIDPQWFGELPRSYYFDEQHQHQAHSGILEESMVRAWLNL